MKQWLVVLAMVIGLVGLGVLAIERSDYTSEIYAAMAGAVCVMLPLMGAFVGWVLTMKTLRRAAEMSALGERSEAAKYGAIKKGIEVFGKPQPPALPAPQGGAWLPPLQEWDVIEGEVE